MDGQIRSLRQNLQIQKPRLKPLDPAQIPFASPVAANPAPTPAVGLTGPGRTTDLEKALIPGAHGPQDLHVALFQSEE